MTMEPMKVKQTVRRMTEARAMLVRDNPFFGHLAMSLHLACAPCGTACTDGSRLIFDPDFAEKMSDRELQFVILHEVLHCVLNHCIRGKNLRNMIYNIACDIVVNSTILAMWGEKTMMVAGSEAMHLTPDGREGRLFSAEEVYYMLIKGNDAGDGSGRDSGSVEDSDSKSGGNDRQPGHISNHGKSVGLSGSSNSCVMTIDRHDLWQGITDGTHIQAVWKVRIKDTLKACGDTSGMPQNIREIVDKLVKKSSLDWRQLLHDFLQYDIYDYSFLPPDRRYSAEDFYLPAYNIDEDNGSAENIWVCVDTSGSFSDMELADAAAEILDAMRQAGLRGKISFFDSNITDPVPFETEREFMKIIPQGGGGTSFHIIFRYMEKHMAAELPRAVLIFTDGYAAWPDEKDAMGVPVLWVISEGGDDKVPWGQVAKM